MSVAEGIDCASSVRDGTVLRRAGKSFVCRYVSTPGNSKNLTLSEARRLRAAGLAIVVVFETTATRAGAGRFAGINDAKSARAQMHECGLTEPFVVYFAVDWDALERQQSAINEYLTGAALVLGKEHVGVYGSFYVVKRALDAGACTYAWQTYGWSGGHWDPRAHIQQYKNDVRLAGMEVDLDRAMKPDYGQWPRPEKPKPKVDTRPAWAKRGDKLEPMWAWFLWRDHGAPPNLRPKQVPARVPLHWFPRYALHRGITPLAKALAKSGK